MLYAPDGRRIRRQIGFLRDWRIEAEERNTPHSVELADCVGTEKIAVSDEEADEAENLRRVEGVRPF
jgi:hypothetical protein